MCTCFPLLLRNGRIDHTPPHECHTLKNHPFTRTLREWLAPAPKNRIMEAPAPSWVVHEFVVTTAAEHGEALAGQRGALGRRRKEKGYFCEEL